VTRVGIPVSADMTEERFPAALESTAYFIVAEAVANAIDAGASRAAIRASAERGALRVEVRDDGAGTERGSGLRDHAAAFDGDLEVQSGPRGGTVVTATLRIPEDA
jgi:signal transduction histidine kinase